MHHLHFELGELYAARGLLWQLIRVDAETMSYFREYNSKCDSDFRYTLLFQ